MNEDDLVNNLYKGINYFSKDAYNRNNPDDRRRMKEYLERFNEKTFNSIKRAKNLYMVFTVLNYLFIIVFLGLTCYSVFAKDEFSIFYLSGTVLSILSAIIWKPQNKLLEFQRRQEQAVALQAVIGEMVNIKDERVKAEILNRLLDKISPGNGKVD